MSGLIGGYRPLTPLRTVGSGSARWCIAARGPEKYFLKQFLSPVYPADPSTPLGQRQRERCEAFEGQKQRLYAALSCVIGDTLVPVLDFFRFERRYYAASEAVFPSDLTADDAAPYPLILPLRETVRAEEFFQHRYGTFFEFYDDRGECDPPQLLRKGKCAPEESPYHQVFFDYGWSASLYIDMVAQLSR